MAFLSDRKRRKDFQLFTVDLATGVVRATPSVDGWVEYLCWSPDGRRILLGVAGHGAEISGGQGAIASALEVAGMPSWLPSVRTVDESCRWRRIWIYELACNHLAEVSHAIGNVWEAAWCGNDALVAVKSAGPNEGLWYSARLAWIDLKNGRIEEIYTPRDQLGWPCASPSGHTVALVEGISSDRWIVAGDLKLVDVASDKVSCVDTHEVDISYLEWRSEHKLLVAGHRGFETVIGLCDSLSLEFSEVWRSTQISGTGHHVAVSGLSSLGDCVLVGEGFTRAPEIAVIRAGEYRQVRSFDLGYADEIERIRSVEAVSWSAPDGLSIQGWLLQPTCNRPHAMVMSIHGGPVGHWHQSWLGRPRTVPLLMLLKSGYAVFLPNPRGSFGRGQDFARRVKGDLNGLDTYDLLSGLDYLVHLGAADPARIGVMGISYGGNMTSWLVTQDARFSAAVSVAPHTNQVTEYLLSNIPDFVALFLQDRYDNAGGRFFHRSPIMHAKKVTTPTLNICGALDRCTPPEEAAQFHSALLESGAQSVLLTYPEEGHGIHALPAAIDYAVRVVDWFEKHMPPGS